MPKLLRWLETAFAAAFALFVVVSPGSRAFLRAWLAVAVEQARVLGPLLSADGAGTAACLLRLLLRLGLAILPSLVLIRHAPWRRRVWLASLLLLVMVFASPISLASCATLGGWLLLLALSLGAAFLAHRKIRWSAWTAALPFLVILQALPRHLLPARRSVDPAFREQLLAECRLHGQRPANLTAERVKPAHAVTALDDDLLLLTGQGAHDDVMFGLPDARPGAWWLRRQGGQLVFDRPSAAEGRFWRACVLDGALWATQEGRMIRARRAGDDEEVLKLRVPGRDLDVGDTGCEPRHRRVYVGEATLGGLWELNPDDKTFKRHEIGLPALLPRGRFDGQVVVNSSARLNVFSPDEARVVERTPSALLSVGYDVCARDGAAAVGDATGRLRVFTLEGGHYRFAWALPLFAPRRVTWSRDCSRIAVTSIDDHSVFIVDAAARRLLEVFEAGPALREVTATAAREFSIADACAVTSYRW